MFRFSFLVLGAFILKFDLYQASDFSATRQNARIEDHPYKVSVSSTLHFLCSGSLLKPKVVLTTGACSEMAEMENLDNVRVRAGSRFTSKGGQLQEVAEMHSHPNYGGFGSQADISILMLKSPFKLSGSVKPVQLSFTVVPDRTAANVTFWGNLDIMKNHGAEEDLKEAVPNGRYVGPTGPRFETLQVMQVSKISHKLCIDKFVYSDEISRELTTCYAFAEGQRNSSQGDFGSAVIMDNKQVGMFRYSLRCTKTQCIAPSINLSDESNNKFIKKFI